MAQDTALPGTDEHGCGSVPWACPVPPPGGGRRPRTVVPGVMVS